jgi:uncharacterized protein YndB with AHSA1/START domain
MLLKIVIGIAVLVAAFVGYVSTKSGQFNYERSGSIKGTPAKIFPYLTDFKLGQEWSPYDKKEDTSIKRKFFGTENQVGSGMEFEGGKSGSGKLEITKIIPQERVEITLWMLKPFKGENHIVYKLTPEEGGTRFTWNMSGDGGFMSKLMTTVIDCEKMIGGQFEEGIANLKKVIEEPK